MDQNMVVPSSQIRDCHTRLCNDCYFFCCTCFVVVVRLSVGAGRGGWALAGGCRGEEGEGESTGATRASRSRTTNTRGRRRVRHVPVTPVSPLSTLTYWIKKVHKCCWNIMSTLTWCYNGYVDANAEINLKVLLYDKNSHLQNRVCKYTYCPRPRRCSRTVAPSWFGL